MGKCQTCEHFSYWAGVSIGLQKIVGRSGLTRPTCSCSFAGFVWERYGAEIRKPKGIKCEYKTRKFTCVYCGKTKSTAGAYITSAVNGTMVCKKCLDKQRKEREAK